MLLNDILNIKTFVDKVVESDLEFVVALKLAKLMKDFAPYIETFDKKKQELFEEYGTRSDDGQQIIIPNEKIADFNVAINGLVSTEVEIEKPIFKLDDFKKLELPMKDVVLIMDFVE